MGGCSAKQQRDRVKESSGFTCEASRQYLVQLVRRKRSFCNKRKSLSASWIANLKPDHCQPDIILSNGCLLSIPQHLNSEIHRLFQFNMMVERCIPYRNASESVLAAAYAELEEQKFEGYQLWRDAVKGNTSTIPGCSESLLSTVFSLPERSWGTEWKKARDTTLSTEMEYKTSVDRKRQKCCDNWESSEELSPFASELIDSYTSLAEIQDHFSWVVGIVFDALINQASHDQFVLYLSQYYRNKLNMLGPESSLKSGNKNIKEQNDLDNTQVTRGDHRKVTVDEEYILERSTLATVCEVLSYGMNVKQEEKSTALKKSLISDWASVGFECLGIYFVLVRNPKTWKVFKREVCFSRRLLFESEYPCVPLINMVDSFGIGLWASAVLPPSFPLPNIPIHLPPLVVRNALSAINQSLVASSLQEIKRLISPLPNAGKYLSAYSPQLVPLDHLAELRCDELVTAAIMALGCSRCFPHQRSSKVQMQHFGEAVARAAKILSHGRLEHARLVSPPTTSNDSGFSASCQLGSSELHLATGFSGNPATKYVALAFNEDEEPVVCQLSPNWTPSDVIELAAREFKCERTNILPYAPVSEHNYDNETKDSIWKAEIFGHQCAVWTPTVVQSPKGLIHTLSVRQPVKRRGPRILLRDLPWESNSFVIVCRPSVLHFRPDVYLPPNKPTSFSIEPIRPVIEILFANIARIRSSRLLHRIYHRFGLSASLTSWRLWDIFTSRGSISAVSHSILGLVSCDIVAAAVKRVVRFHSCDATSAIRTASPRSALECLLWTLFHRPGTEWLDLQSSRIMYQFLNIALWLSLVQVSKIPVTFFDCLMDRCSIHIKPEVLSTDHEGLKEWFPLSPYNLQHKNRVSFTPPASPSSGMEGSGSPTNLFKGISDHFPSLERAAQAQSADMMTPLNLKIKTTFPSRDYICHILCIYAFDTGQQSLLRLLAYSLDFSDCYPLPEFVSSFISSSTRTVPPYNDVFPEKISNFFLRSLFEPQTATSSFSCIEAPLRVCLSSYLDSAVIAFARSRAATGSWEAGADKILHLCSEYVGKMKDRALIDLVCGALILVAFLSILCESDIEKASLLLHDALRLLLHGFGDPTLRGGRGASSMLYLSWLLSRIHRLHHEPVLARWYERIFRSVRLSSPHCPLSIAPPIIPENLRENVRCFTNQEVISILQYNHQHLTESNLNWLLATNVLSDGYEVIDFYSSSHQVSSEPPSPRSASKFLERSRSRYSIPVQLESTLPALSVVGSHIPEGQLLSFGSNTSGCLGLGLPSHPTPWNGCDVYWTSEPQVVPSLKDFTVTAIASGGFHTIVLTEESFVFVWGDNQYGQLGVDAAATEFDLLETQCYSIDAFSWIENSDPSSSVSDAVEPFFSQKVDPDGPKKSASNSSKSRDSKKTSAASVFTSSEPTMMSSFISTPVALQLDPLNSSIIIKSICCGLNFSSAVTSTGKLYTWGCNRFGQLGLGDYQDRPRPTLNELASKTYVEKVSCGHEHMGLLSGCGSLWMWGKGTEGQLGVPLRCLEVIGDVERARLEYQSWESSSTPYSHRPEAIEAPEIQILSLASKEVVGCVSKPQRVSVFQFIEETNRTTDERVIAIGLTASPEYVTWRKDPQDRDFYACTVTSNSDEFVVHSEEVQFLELSCGAFHTMAVDISNYVWVWGRGDAGQLGLGSLDDSDTKEASWALLEIDARTVNEGIFRYTPCRLSRFSFGNERITNVYCGVKTSAAIDDQNFLWTFGTNENYGLATEDDACLTTSPIPTRATRLQDREVLFYAAGWSGSRFGILDSQGNITLWGEDTCGILGSCPVGENDQWKDIPCPIDPIKICALPATAAHWLKNTRIDMLAIGMHHVVVQTGTGEKL